MNNQSQWIILLEELPTYLTFPLLIDVVTMKYNIKSTIRASSNKICNLNLVVSFNIGGENHNISLSSSARKEKN